MCGQFLTKSGMMLLIGLCVGPVQAAEVKVGLLLPYAGVYASLAKEIDSSFVMALKEAGMHDQIKIFREDTEVKPPIGLAKTRKLVLQDKVDVLVGVVSSGVLGAMRDFVDQAKIPLIVANAGNDDATGNRCTPYITRISFSNSQITRPMGPWMYERGIRKVYTLAPDYAAGHQAIGGFVETFKKAGGEIVGQEFTPFRTTKDFGPYLTKAKAASPDAIFVFYAGGEAISFVKQYGTLGLKKSVPLYASGFLTSPLYVNAEGTAAEGIIAALHYIPTLKTPENAAFVKLYRANHNKAPSEFAVQGYDAGRALSLSIQKGAQDRESLAKALRSISYTGPRGPMRIDPKTNNIIQNIYIYETVTGMDGLTQKLLGQVENVRGPDSGCAM